MHRKFTEFGLINRPLFLIDNFINEQIRRRGKPEKLLWSDRQAQINADKHIKKDVAIRRTQHGLQEQAVKIVSENIHEHNGQDEYWVDECQD